MGSERVRNAPLIVVIAILGFVLAASACGSAAPDRDTDAMPTPQWDSPEPEVVARVNGDPITEDELQRMLANPVVAPRLQQELDSADPDGREVERLALGKLIHGRLLIQEAERRGISVTDEELDQAIVAMRDRFEDLTSFGIWMEAQGLDEATLFQTIQNEMLAERVRQALVENVRVTEEEARTYYEAHKDDPIQLQQVRLRIIVVQSESDGEEIMAALEAGESFDRLAYERSVGQRAAVGGDTGWVNYQTLSPWLQGVVGVLSAGDVAGPMERAAEEFFIVGLQGWRSVEAQSLEEARPEIERRLLAMKQQETLDAWLAEQEKKSNIEVFE